jgi:hypothetical protein
MLEYFLIAYAIFATYRVGKLSRLVVSLRTLCADLESRLILTTLGKRPDDKFH